MTRLSSPGCNLPVVTSDVTATLWLSPALKCIKIVLYIPNMSALNRRRLARTSFAQRWALRVLIAADEIFPACSWSFLRLRSSWLLSARENHSDSWIINFKGKMRISKEPTEISFNSVEVSRDNTFNACTSTTSFDPMSYILRFSYLLN